jgi:hypothetical protein
MNILSAHRSSNPIWPAFQRSARRSSNPLTQADRIQTAAGRTARAGFAEQGRPRTHSGKQVRQITDSIQRFGFTNPVLVSNDNEIIAGHGRVEAAILLRMESVPTLRLSHLDAAQRRAHVLADNKLALNAGWDREVLAIELQALVDLEFDVEITGFSLAEVDVLLDDAREASPDPEHQTEDTVPRRCRPAQKCHPTVKPVALVADAIREGHASRLGWNGRSVSHRRALSCEGAPDSGKPRGDCRDGRARKVWRVTGEQRLQGGPLERGAGEAAIVVDSASARQIA